MGSAVIGGPFCGTLPRRFPGCGWMWLSAAGTVRSRPGTSYECYRYNPSTRRWYYAGHHWVTCAGCGAQHLRADRCQLCGHALA
jgi:methionyl-tRNA synthetase